MNKKENARRYREEHRERIKNVKKVWYEKNRARVLLKCGQRRKENSARVNRLGRLRTWVLKLEVMEHYSAGEMKCACCGEKDVRFLTIDHVCGGGEQHRKGISHGCGGKDMYRWMIKNKYPAGFRVLCMNCNFAIGVYGACPHEELLNDFIERKNLDREIFAKFNKS